MPGAIVSDSPVVAPASAGMPQSGAPTRGNSTNSSAAIGIPWSIITPVRLIASTGRREEADPGARASASSVAPSTSSTGIAAIAANGDWLEKNGVTSRNEASATRSVPSRTVRVSRNLMPTRMNRKATDGSRPSR